MPNNKASSVYEAKFDKNEWEMANWTIVIRSLNIQI